MTDRLTRTEILEMGPGRQLDDLVAVQVMGWHLTATLGVWTWVDARGKPEYDQVEWAPSANIEDAWAVVQELIGKEFGFDLSSTLRYNNDEFQGSDWLCCVVDDQGIESYASGGTAPEAICKVALAVNQGGS